MYKPCDDCPHNNIPVFGQCRPDCHYKQTLKYSSLIKENLEEVMYSHSHDSEWTYNECDKNPCKWCEDAKIIIDHINSLVE